MKIVVTGNIGAGKSTVIKMLMPLLPQFKLFDFDQAVKELYSDIHFVAALIRAFGTGDKAEVSNIVHKDPALLSKLEQMSSGALINKVIDASISENVVYDIPLFCEFRASWPFLPDVIITIDTPKEIRFKRVKERNDWPDEKIEAVMAKQWSDEDKRKAADYVIYNSTSLGTLEWQVGVVADLIKQRFMV